MDDFNLAGVFGSTAAIKEALRAGLGVSVLSLLAVEPELAAGTLRIVEIEGLGRIKRDFFAVTNRALTLSPVAESFLDFALRHSARAERVG